MLLIIVEMNELTESFTSCLCPFARVKLIIVSAKTNEGGETCSTSKRLEL